ncbi:hypothetical protein ACFX19_033199 [Malus domestica]
MHDTTSLPKPQYISAFLFLNAQHKQHLFTLSEGFVTDRVIDSKNYRFCLFVMDDQDLGFFANFLGIFIFLLVIAYHFVMADPKYEGN